MLRDVRRLIEQTVAITGAPPPEATQETAPILADDAMGSTAPDFYLIGLIGGKNVGKSSLVNALVGREITPQSSHGTGTRGAIAYLHASIAGRVCELLEHEIPGRYEIITHQIDALSRQVLLDLPDFDSHFAEHLEVTRRMLRHMLFPVWVQSVEKYADSRPRELLLQVTAGNAPANFVFCLNKVDQLVSREGEQAARELCADYASRIASAAGLSKPPRVFMISAIHPERWELPDLRELLGREKPVKAVAASRELALQRQSLTLLSWFDRQGLTAERDRLARLEEQARGLLTADVAGPFVEHCLPALMDDASLRTILVGEIMQHRVARWPVVRALHVLLDPVLGTLRGRVTVQSAQATAMEPVVGAHLEPAGRSLATRIQAAFARLQQSNPQVSSIYADHRHWEPMQAETAAADLRQDLTAAIEYQREMMRRKLGRGGGPIGWLARIAMTAGAAVWFPLVQPVLDTWLRSGKTTDVLLLLLGIFSAPHLLKSAGFLAIWFVFLWLMLQWRCRRGVDRWIEKWKDADPLDPDQSLAAQVLEWTERFLDPIRNRRERIAELIETADRLRAELKQSAAASAA